MDYMQWFKLYADLQHHPKRYRFEELASTEYGLHYLTAWFGYVCRFAPSGDVTGFTPREVARACEWKGDAQVFWNALLGAGFIEKTKKGYCSHDWYEENGRFIRENEHRKPVGKPRVTLGKPLLQDKTGQDNTNNTTSLPTPTRQARVDDASEGEGKGREGKGINPSAAGAEFEQFWTAYPKKKSKGAALKAWSTLKPPIGSILVALQWQRRQFDWTKDQGQFVPYPATYLRAQGWKDEPPKDLTAKPWACPKCGTSSNRVNHTGLCLTCTDNRKDAHA